MSEWLPIETHTEEPILEKLFVTDGEIVWLAWRDGFGRFYDALNDGPPLKGLTHWQPWPEPPAAPAPTSPA